MILQGVCFFNCNDLTLQAQQIKNSENTSLIYSELDGFVAGLWLSCVPSSVTDRGNRYQTPLP